MRALKSLRTRPWEYIALQVTPAQWREEDVVLVSFAMWWDLQANSLLREKLRVAINMRLGGPECANGWKCALEFIYPRGTSWDSPNTASAAPSQVAPVRLPTPKSSICVRQCAKRRRPRAPTRIRHAPGSLSSGPIRIEATIRSRSSRCRPRHPRRRPWGATAGSSAARSPRAAVRWSRATCTSACAFRRSGIARGCSSFPRAAVLRPSI